MQRVAHSRTVRWPLGSCAERNARDYGGLTLNEDQAKGKAKQAKGEAQEGWGDVKETPGQALEQAKDKGGNAWDDVQVKAGDAWDAAKEKAGELRVKDERSDAREHEGSGGDEA